MNAINATLYDKLVFNSLNDLASVLFEPLPASIQYIKSGKIRGLAVTTAARSEALPDLPAMVAVRFFRNRLLWLDELHHKLIFWLRRIGRVLVAGV